MQYFYPGDKCLSVKPSDKAYMSQEFSHVALKTLLIERGLLLGEFCAHIVRHSRGPTEKRCGTLNLVEPSRPWHKVAHGHSTGMLKKMGKRVTEFLFLSKTEWSKRSK